MTTVSYPMPDEFKTIKEIAPQTNKSERVLREAMNILEARGLLHQEKDFIKENYRDEKHFMYRVKLERLVEEYNKITKAPILILVDENPFGQPLGQPFVDKPVDEQTTRKPVGQQTVNGSVNGAGNQDGSVMARGEQPHPRIENRDQEIAIRDDFISTLKEQLKAKDHQITQLEGNLRQVNYNLQTVLQALPEPLKKEYASKPIDAQYDDPSHGDHLAESAAVDQSAIKEPDSLDELVYEQYSQETSR